MSRVAAAAPSYGAVDRGPRRGSRPRPAAAAHDDDELARALPERARARREPDDDVPDEHAARARRPHRADLLARDLRDRRRAPVRDRAPRRVRAAELRPRLRPALRVARVVRLPPRPGDRRADRRVRRARAAAGRGGAALARLRHRLRDVDRERHALGRRGACCRARRSCGRASARRPRRRSVRRHRARRARQLERRVARVRSCLRGLAAGLALVRDPHVEAQMEAKDVRTAASAPRRRAAARARRRDHELLAHPRRRDAAQRRRRGQLLVLRGHVPRARAQHPRVPRSTAGTSSRASSSPRPTARSRRRRAALDAVSVARAGATALVFAGAFGHVAWLESGPSLVALFFAYAPPAACSRRGRSAHHGAAATTATSPSVGVAHARRSRAPGSPSGRPPRRARGRRGAFPCASCGPRATPMPRRRTWPGGGALAERGHRSPTRMCAAALERRRQELRPRSAVARPPARRARRRRRVIDEPRPSSAAARARAGLPPARARTARASAARKRPKVAVERNCPVERRGAARPSGAAPPAAGASSAAMTATSLGHGDSAAASRSSYTTSAASTSVAVASHAPNAASSASSASSSPPRLPPRPRPRRWRASIDGAAGRGERARRETVKVERKHRDLDRRRAPRRRARRVQLA